MHVYVLGGSGRTGQLIIEEALRRKHTVTALVRDPSKIETRDGLTLVRGSPANYSDIESSLSQGGKPDAVLVAMSAQNTDNPFKKLPVPENFLTDINKNVVKAMQAKSVRKIVILQAMGVSESKPSMNFLMRFMTTYLPMGQQFRDHDESGKWVPAQNGIDSVMVRPSMLTDKPAAPIKEHGNTGEGAGFFPQITRASVANFMLDAAESDKWNGQGPVITN